MLCNVDKCHIIHAGQGNPCHEYTMGGRVLEEVDFEKDVGVLLHKSFRPSMQCANSVLGQLCRGISYRDRDIFIGLRLHLEYCVQAWCPWTIGDKEVLEAVQRRAVGMVTNFNGKTYQGKMARHGQLGGKE